MSAEHRLQMAAYKFLKHALPEYSVVFSMDAGIKSSPVSAMLAKHRGIVAGIPDMVCLVPRHPSIWIELKAGRGRISERQNSMHTAIGAAGHHVFTAFSLEEIEAGLKAFGISLRATTQTPAQIDAALAARVSTPTKRASTKQIQISKIEAIRRKVPF